MVDVNYESCEYIEGHFKDHIIYDSEVSIDKHGNEYGWYYVRNPKESPFWFKITFSAGCFMLTGDVGSLVFPGKSLGWLSKSVCDSTQYLTEKIDQDMWHSLYEIDENLASDFLDSEEDRLKEDDADTNDRLADVIESARDIIDEMDHSNSNHWNIWEYRFLDETHDLWVDEPPTITKLNISTRYKIAALKCFCRLKGI